MSTASAPNHETKKDERKDQTSPATTKPQTAPTPPAPAVDEADEDALDRLDAVGKVIRILRKFPPTERQAIVASLAELVR